MQSPDSLSRAAGRPDWDSTHDVDVPLLQHSLSRTIDEATFDIFRASAAHPRQKALMLSTSIRHAGDWLNVVPSSALGLHLLDQEFRLCLKYWLGLQIFEEHQKCPVCLTLADKFGDHHVGCGGNADRIFRHNSLRDAVFSAAQSAALAPRKEVPSLIPGSQHRPADVYLPCWKGGRPAALDITVISTMRQSTIQPAADNQGHALFVAETRKFATHGPACQAVGISFIPLAIETLDGNCRNHLWHWPPHRPTFWGLPPRVVPSPFPKACHLIMERERNSLDTSLSTTCSKRRRGSLRRLLCCVCLSLCFHCVCHVLPCVLICRFFWFVFFCLYIYKWKNHFYEMKGDVGMSVHEKERKQEDAYTKTQTHS